MHPPGGGVGVAVVGPDTVKLATAALPAPALVEVTVPVVLSRTPAAVAVTLTANRQEPPAGSVPPVRLMLPDPAVAAGVLPHEPVSPLGVATTRPAGSVSVNATPVSATESGLVMVKLRVVVPPTGTLAPNRLAIVGGDTTVRTALAVLPVPPSFEVMGPVVLVLSPAVVAVTFTWTSQASGPTRRLPPV